MSQREVFDYLGTSHIMEMTIDEMRILPLDQRKPVLNTLIHPFNSIGKVMVKIQFQQKGVKKIVNCSGAGTILSNNVVMSSAHILNLKKPNILNIDIYFYPAVLQQKLSSNKFKGIRVKSFHVNKSYTQYKNDLSQRNDFVILILEENKLINQEQHLTIKWDYQLFKFKQTKIMIAGYSDDSFLMSHFSDQNNIGLYFQERIPDQQREILLFYLHSTEEGTSGSPLLLKDQNGRYEMIGIHKGSVGNKNYGLLLNNLSNTQCIFNQLIEKNSLKEELHKIYYPSYSAISQQNLRLKQQLSSRQKQVHSLGHKTQVQEKRIQDLQKLFKNLNIKGSKNPYSNFIIQSNNYEISNPENIGNSIVQITLEQMLNQSEANKIKYILSKIDKTILEIDFRGQKIGDEGFKVFVSQAAGTFKNLTTMQFETNNISSQGFKYFTQKIKFFQNLEKIDLSWNCIGDDGFKAFAQETNQLKKLKFINFGHNHITTDGFMAFCRNSISLKTLTTIEFWSNNIGKEGFKAFIDQAENFESLTTADFSKNNIGDQGFVYFVKKVNNFKKLASIDFSYNKIDLSIIKSFTSITSCKITILY